MSIGYDTNVYVNRSPRGISYLHRSLYALDFAAILTGGQWAKSAGDLKKTDYQQPATATQEIGSDYVATGRFSFYRKHLYFSFYTNRPTRPRMVQFIDANGNIIEEIVSPSSRGLKEDITFFFTPCSRYAEHVPIRYIFAGRPCGRWFPNRWSAMPKNFFRDFYQFIPLKKI